MHLLIIILAVCALVGAIASNFTKVPLWAAVLCLALIEILRIAQ